MGVVYKARHRELNRIVALKMLRGAAASDPEFRNRFRIEAEAVAQLQHPNIIQVFEVGTVEPMPGDLEPSPFIALEFVDGASLAHFTIAPQTPQFAARMVETLARAAHAAHRVGVVHRDLKPANVLLTHAGEPKIADFGVAKQIGIERDPSGRFVTQTGIAVGTPEYMAPEQVSGEAPTPAIDTYALGVILYELLTARVPFQGPNPADTMYLARLQEPVPPRRLQPGLSRDLETICLKCLAKTPGQRYESAEALADDLARWADGRAIHARPVGVVGRTIRWARRNPTIAALSVAIVLVALAGLTGVLVNWREARTQADTANTALGEAKESARAERWERYRADIIAASSAIQIHDIGAARRALEAAPEEYRNWEWRFFSQQLDTSREILGGEGAKVHWVLIPKGATTVATVADDDTARFWDVTGRREFGHVPSSHEMGKSIISPDGQILAYVPFDTSDKTLILREIATGRTRAVLHGHDSPIVASNFSPDSARVATSSRDGIVRIWETATGKELLLLHAHDTPVGPIAFSADGRMIATPGTKDRTLRVWDAETGKPLSVFRGHSWNVDHAAFSPSGDRLLAMAGFPANKLWLWNNITGEMIAEMTGHTNQIRSFVFSPDGNRIATASLDQTIRLWDGKTGKLVTVIRGHAGWISSVAFSPDGSRLISASDDRTVRIWDAENGTAVAVLHGHTGEVFKAGFTSDGTTIVSGSRDKTVRLWDARKSETNNTFRGHTNFVYGVAFHPDGERVASASWDGTVRIWNATTGQQISLLRYEEGTIVSSVAFHPDGELVATLGRDNAVRLWDVSTGREIHRWSAPTKFWQDSRLTFSPNGDLLAAGGMDGAVRLWDVKSKAELAVLRGHQGAIRDVAFSPDGRWIASAGEIMDPTVRIWDVVRREQVCVLAGHTDIVYSLAFSRDGTLLASGSVDKTVRLWDTTTWQKVDDLRPGTNVYGLAFSHDGTRLASACADNTIRFWDVAKRQEVAELRGHGDYVHSIAFSKDGTRLVSASGDFTVRVWDTLSSQDRGK
jgi:WD40 repeat protein